MSNLPENERNLEENISEVIAAEKERRNNVYAKLVNLAPKLSSPNYGTLILNEDGTFKWTKYKLLVPSVIPAGVKNAGTATIKYTLSKSLTISLNLLRFFFVKRSRFMSPHNNTSVSSFLTLWRK